jgi:hypothetical protein
MRRGLLLTTTVLPTLSPVLQEVGNRVECYTGDWQLGTVVKQWFREDEWAEDIWTAYQVKLDTGQYIYAPLDQDLVCRAAPELSSSEEEEPMSSEPVQPQKLGLTWAEIGTWDA